MCRLFGLLSADERACRPYLVEGEHSLLAQASADPTRLQRDGWGLAGRDLDGSVWITKGREGLDLREERGRFLAAADRAHGPLVIGHLRRASDPMGLGRARLLGIENSQPFSHAGRLFAHNGAIPLPGELRERLGAYAAQLKGVNDSEVLFALLQRNLDERGNPLAAYAATVNDLTSVWEENDRPTPSPCTGLNLLLSPQADELWAFSLSAGDHGRALADRSSPYFEMTCRAEPSAIVVGSERLDGEPGWTPLPSGTYLAARRIRGTVQVRRGELPVKLPTAPFPG